MLPNLKPPLDRRPRDRSQLPELGGRPGKHEHVVAFAGRDFGSSDCVDSFHWNTSTTTWVSCCFPHSTAMPSKPRIELGHKCAHLAMLSFFCAALRVGKKEQRPLAGSQRQREEISARELRAH